MARSDGAPKRCAIYTRKSSEEGLEQNFNSLHAQRPPIATSTPLTPPDGMTKSPSMRYEVPIVLGVSVG